MLYLLTPAGLEAGDVVLALLELRAEVVLLVYELRVDVLDGCQLLLVVRLHLLHLRNQLGELRVVSCSSARVDDRAHVLAVCCRRDQVLGQAEAVFGPVARVGDHFHLVRGALGEPCFRWRTLLDLIEALEQVVDFVVHVLLLGLGLVRRRLEHSNRAHKVHLVEDQ